LKIDFLHQSKGSKVRAIEEMLARTGLDWDEVCYAGDDIVDLGPLKRAGVAVAVANAVPEVLAAAHYVTRASGGQGAVREIAEMILKAQDKWQQLIAEHSK
jgi:3-deoxy-D-manno-octulosonate 8-phosphate phosphatase (KDO 8-P phosphatase)